MREGVLGITLRRVLFVIERNIEEVKYPRPHHATGYSIDTVMNTHRKRVIGQFGEKIDIYREDASARCNKRSIY